MIHQIMQVKTDTLNMDGLRREFEYKSSAGDLKIPFAEIPTLKTINSIV